MARQRGRTWAVWGSAAQGGQVAWELGVWAGSKASKLQATSSWNSLRIANLPVLKPPT